MCVRGNGAGRGCLPSTTSARCNDNAGVYVRAAVGDIFRPHDDPCLLLRVKVSWEFAARFNNGEVHRGPPVDNLRPPGLGEHKATAWATTDVR